MTSHETKVREAAYRLWEFAGRPEGRDVEFWCKAELSVEVEAVRVRPKKIEDLTMPWRTRRSTVAVEIIAAGSRSKPM